jgi:alginate O-acetyltransferase complex protein AlgI
MLLGGLWHGASWNFVVWGGIHGGMLAFERTQGRTSLYRNLPRALRITVTFLIVCIGWVFFRAANLPRALHYLAAMFGIGQAAAPADLLRGIIYQPYYLVSLGAAAVVVWLGKQTWDWSQEMTWPKAIVCGGLGWVALAVMATQEYNPFIYFIF